MHKQARRVAGAAAAHAVARAEVSDDRRAHFGAPLVVLLHRGAAWRAGSARRVHLLVLRT
eukprot:2929801-Prymnesium_polylepis.1